MPATQEPTPARASLRGDGDTVEVAVGGVWKLEGATPRWGTLVAGAKPKAIRVRPEGLGPWDTALVAFLGETERWCADAGVPCDTAAMPEKARLLGNQFAASLRAGPRTEHSRSFLVEVGLSTRGAMEQCRDLLQFVGESWIALGRLVFGRAGIRWGDYITEVQKCGAMALPIVSLISFLVGVTLAYSGAIVLRRFGGDIWVADFIGVAMTREMGAMMAGVVLAGRTGAAYAAEIGSMKANEEIDALTILGISPVRFLVLPRVIALALMMPLLALYANCLGVLGGMAVAKVTLDIPPTAYWVEMLTIVDLPDVMVGVIKSIVFGLIVGLSGCRKGLQADNNAQGVGRAATSAVVTAILLIIVADAIFAVVFHAVGM
ncbi:MAG TPA: ABC transporter permease [Opitutaceae bacterium]|jgi:phospholipid/cholesterol/gamma-HCH transport system permease protein